MKNIKGVSHFEHLRRVSVTVVAVILLSCGGSHQVSDTVSGTVNPFPTFHDVPGITAEEIAAIETLQREYASFSFGLIPGSESFIKENGEIGGYISIICAYLSDFFGIPFQPKIIVFPQIVSGLNNRTLDFSGTVTATPERLQMYSMTSPIAERQLRMMRLWGSPSLEQISKERLPRYGLNSTSNNRNLVVAALTPGTYEIVDTLTINDGYQALLEGRADVYIEANIVVDSFPAPDVYSESFFPLIFTPVSMATGNPELAPIISVMEKALQNGARAYINYLNNLGSNELRIERFHSQLTDEERAYLQNPSPVPLAVRYYNYPMGFYNSYEKNWEGIIFDVLAEVGKLAGLTFQVANDEHTEMDTSLKMLYD
jgi:ABC-type amino acid transport substrate-binding protein